jgi:hypothetical protein
VAELTDSFDGSLLDTNRWSALLPLGGTFTVNDALILTNDSTSGSFCHTPGSGYAVGTGVGSRRKLTGDFDISVDFSGIHGPQANFTQAFFTVHQDLNNEAHIKFLRRTTGDYIQGVAKVGGVITNGGEIVAGATSGTFRITRTGASFVFAFNGVTHLSWAGFTGDVFVALSVLSSTTGGVTYDNFVRTLGTVLDEPVWCEGDGFAGSSAAALTDNFDGYVGSPVALVFDMKNLPREPLTQIDQIGQWYTRSLVENPVAAAALNGVVYWLGSSGKVRYELEEQWYDAPDIAIFTKYHFAQISAAQLQAAKAIYRVLIDGEYRGACTQRVTAYIVEEQTRGDPVVWTDDVAMSDSSKEEFDFTPDPRRATTIEIVIEEVASGQLTEGWRLRSMAFEIGSTGKLRKLGPSQKIGD